jgi:hypothetical protein
MFANIHLNGHGPATHFTIFNIFLVGNRNIHEQIYHLPTIGALHARRIGHGICPSPEIFFQIGWFRIRASERDANDQRTPPCFLPDLNLLFPVGPYLISCFNFSWLCCLNAVPTAARPPQVTDCKWIIYHIGQLTEHRANALGRYTYGAGEENEPFKKRVPCPEPIPPPQ